MVAASTDILIGDAGAQHVLIRPLSRTTPGLFDDSHDSAIACEIEIAVGGFRGQFAAELRTEEFQSLLDEIEASGTALENAANFDALSGQIDLSLIGDGAGNILVAGYVADAADDGNRLEFAFAMGEAVMPDLVRSLEQVLAAFPLHGPH
jgi:hypothetical protein